MVKTPFSMVARSAFSHEADALSVESLLEHAEIPNAKATVNAITNPLRFFMKCLS
jgi:hypothetical protein